RLSKDTLLLKLLRNLLQSDLCMGICLEDAPHDCGLSFVHDHAGKVGRRLPDVVIPERVDAGAHELPLRKPVLPAARGALDDFGTFKFRDRAKNLHGEIVLGVLYEVLAVDDEALAMFDYLFNDDGLDYHFARDAVGLVEVNDIEDVGLEVL